MFISQAPNSRAPKPEQRVQPLTDDQVVAAFKRLELWWNYGNDRVEARVIGWKTERGGPRSGQLGAVVLNPRTNERYHYGVDPRTRKIFCIQPIIHKN